MKTQVEIKSRLQLNFKFLVCIKSIWNLYSIVFDHISNRVAKWLSQKYRTLTVPMSVAQNIELLTHALLFGITIIFVPNKEPKYRTVRLNAGHLATLISKALLPHFQNYNYNPKLVNKLLSYACLSSGALEVGRYRLQVYFRYFSIFGPC